MWHKLKTQLGVQRVQMVYVFAGTMVFEVWVFCANALLPLMTGRTTYSKWGVVGYLFTGVAGSLLQIVLMPGSSIATIGASGAISGVMGAYLVLFPRARVLTLIPIFFFIRLIYLPAPLLLGFWILIQVISGCGSVPGTGGGVAYFAHIGGFASGIILGLVVRNRVRRPWYEIS